MERRIIKAAINVILAIIIMVAMVAYVLFRSEKVEKVEIESAYVVHKGDYYVMTVDYVNTGSLATSIDSISLNGVSYMDFRPVPILNGSFKSLPSYCEMGVLKSGTIFIKIGTTNPVGNQLNTSVSLTIMLHTTGGNDYPKSIAFIDQVNDTGIVSVGVYGSYGFSANMAYNTDPGTWDAFPIYGPTSDPSNRFNFAYLTAEYGVTDTGARFNVYLNAIKSYNRQVFYRLYWGQTYDDLAGTEAKVQDMMTGVDTSLIAGVIFGDDVRWNDPGVPQFLNSLYDWFKSTYPGVAVYQVWSPLENEGPADGRPGFQSSWKADGWVWYSYWANYTRTKAFIQSCKTTQPGKPIMMIIDFSAPWGSGFDPYTHTPEQVRVAREEGCSVCLYSFSETDRKYGWWTSDPLTKQRYAAGEALIDEVKP